MEEETLDTINEQQRRLLNEYQSVTHTEDIEESIRILSRNHWNLELAVQNRYTPESTSLYQQDESSTSALLGTTTTPRVPSRSNRPFMSFFMWPFSLCWKLTWRLFQFTSRLLYRPSIAAPRTDPRSEADRFLREFESSFGTTHPPFYSGSYTQALTVAKRDLQYLLVMLSSEEHDDHFSFCHDILTNADLIDFLRKEQVIMWGGNVRYTEAFQVSNTLQATTYPFLAIIGLHESKMQVLDRMEGPLTVATILRRLENAMHRSQLNQLRQERQVREVERRLREEQDQAYQNSLKADQAKQRQLEAERELQLQKEKEEQKQEMYRQVYLQKLIPLFKEEPSENVTRISFRLANGDRVIRKFKGTDTLATLYQFVQVYPLLNQAVEDCSSVEVPDNYQFEYTFTIHSPFPRTVYEPSAKPISEEKGLWPSATLIVDQE